LAPGADHLQAHNTVSSIHNAAAPTTVTVAGSKAQLHVHNSLPLAKKLPHNNENKHELITSCTA
jgi:hypothetical protein